MATETNNIADPSSSQRGSADRARQTAHDAIDRVATKAGPAIDQVLSAATNAAQALQSKADALGDLEDQWVESARGYVREHPLTAVTLGVMAGLLLSRITR